MGVKSNKQFNTLTEAIEFAAKNTSKGIFFIGERDTDNFVSYADVFDNALKIAAKLQRIGLKKGDELIFQFQENQNFINTFWACLFSGIIPVPLSLGISEEHKRKLERLWTKLNNPYLISDKKKTPEVPEIAEKTIQFETLFEGGSAPFAPVEINADDIAFVQFSSGSTGSPKGVTLTHANLLANVNAIHNGIQSTEEGDSFFSWMPLTHDMGLIGFHLTPLFKAWTHYIMPTSMFIRNPIAWLRKIEQYAISFTSSPNFGYQYVLKNLERKANQSMTFDLSSLRIIVNGAEPISASLCEKFTKSMKVFGLKENVIFPVYGLAEASLAVTFTDWKKRVDAVKINREYLGIGDSVKLLEDHATGAEFVNVGSPILDCETRITDAEGNLLEDLKVGRIEIRGLNVTSGYYNDPEVSRKLINEDGWLDTGDLGFVLNGELYVTGRLKDVMFVNGQNFYAHDLERAIEELDDLELGKVVVTGYHDPNLQRDAIAVFILFKGKLSGFTEIVKDVRKVLSKSTSVLPDYILPVRKIPKTTSGKVQRYALSSAMREGEFDAVLDELRQIENKNLDGFFSGWSENEHKLGLIWQQILGHTDFDRNDNFFSIGGNSLKAGEVCTMVAERLHQNLTLADLFKSQSISGVVALIKDNLLGTYQEFKVARNSSFSTLSNGQRNIYYFTVSNPESTAYVIPTLLKLNTVLRPEVLELALQKLVDRHRVLRTYFAKNGDEPLQYTKDSFSTNVKHIRIDEEDWRTTLNEFVQPFNIHELPLYTCILAESKADDCSYLMFNVHHIIADGTTVELLINELFDLYNEKPVEEIKYHFTDLIQYERDTLTNNELFWKEYLSNTPLLELPLDQNRPSVFSYEGKKVRWSVSNELSSQLHQFCELHSTTSFQVLLSSYLVFLKAISNQDDFSVGVPLNARNVFEARKIAGMFVNNLIFRSRTTGDESFLELVKEVRDDFLHLFDKGDYNLSSLTRQLEKVRDLSRNPLFDVMFVYQNSIMQLDYDSKPYEYEVFDSGTAKYDLTMEVIEGKNTFDFYVEYNTSLFKPSTISKFEEHFNSILRAALMEPNTSLKNIGRYSLKDAVLKGSNVSIPQQNICAPIVDMANRIPDVVAIRSSKSELTYGELVLRSTQLASCLIESGISPGDPVMLVMDRSVDFLIAVLGTLLSGGCFVPVDPELPENRIAYIFKDCGAKVTIVSEHSVGSSDLSPITISELFDTKIGEATLPVVNPSDLAYIIYTSGTTGKPKGVMIEHKAAQNYSLWAANTYFKESNSVVPLYTSISFDLTITSILPPLLSGNTIAVFDDLDQQSVFEQLLGDKSINVIKATPSHLKIFKELERVIDTSTSKVLIVGGEDLSTELAREILWIFGHDIELYNEYGPTEATVGCMVRKYLPETDVERSVPIGKPINNTSLAVVDQNFVPVLDGAIGELLISGAGLARGYRNNTTSTNERFITVPEFNNQRFYRSGDLVKKNDRSELVYLGRVDEQVKINGFRIELGEIEHCLKDLSEIQEAVVCVKENNVQGQIICAYFVKSDNKNNLAQSKIKEHLLTYLPAYMVPSSYTVISEIPLTVNGKVAINELPDPFSKKFDEKIREPNELEQEVIAVWESVFKVENELSIRDNFFVLGGDSIVAIQVVSALQSRGFKTKVNDVLRYPEIESFAPRMEEAEVEYDQDALHGDLGMTPIYKWFRNLKLTEPEYYNQSVLLKLENGIDALQIQIAFDQLIHHHDALRINIDSVSGYMGFNKVHLNAPFFLERYVFTESDDEDQRLKEVGLKLKSEMDLQKGLLIKAAHLKFEDVQQYVLIVCHHIIIDGVSWRILLQDLYTILKNPKTTLPAKTASMRDWSKYLSSEEIVNSAKEDQTFSELGALEIQPESNEANTRVEYELSYQKNGINDLIGSVQDLYNVTPEIAILAVILRALSDMDGKKKRVVELEHHGRSMETINVTRTVGWFTSVYPVLVNTADIKEPEEQLLYLKELINEIDDNGFEYGVRRMNKTDHVEVYPDIRLNYLGKFGNELNNDLFILSEKFTGVDVGAKNKTTAKLEVNCMLLDNNFIVQIVTSENHFKPEDILRLEKGIENQINEIIGSIVRDDNEGKFTPSDFKLSDIEQDDLDQLFLE